MSAPDADELARKTLELWQDQLSALAGDPETGAAMAKLMTMATLGSAAAMKALAEAVGGSLKPNGAAVIQQPNEPAAGATAAAIASGAGDDRLSGLERRLAEIERRLATLEASAGPARSRPGRRSRKPRSRSPR